MDTKNLKFTQTQKFNSKEELLKCLIDESAICVDGLSKIAKKYCLSLCKI